MAKQKIKFVDVSGYTASQVENAFNNNYAEKGWRIIQVVEIGTKRYLVAENLI